MATTDERPAGEAPLGPAVDPHPARRPERRTFEGRYVRLEPLDPDRHADELYEGSHGAGNEAVWTYLFEAPFADRDSFRAHVERKAASTDPVYYAIVDKASGRTVGQATLMRIEPAHRVIEVGSILYTPQLQRTPGATEAMYLLASYVFDDLGYRRYEWKCNNLNAPSKRAAERLGFAFEGVFRRHMIVKGRNRDTAWFSMLDTEWPARKAAFERWLSPGNFDTSGRQREALAELNKAAPP